MSEKNAPPFVEEDNRPDPIVYLLLIVASFMAGFIVALIMFGSVTWPS